MTSEPSATKELREPDPWDYYEDSPMQWENIIMRDLVYSDLPPGAVDAIESVIKMPETLGHDIAKIHKPDAKTIEIVWFNDGKGENESPSKIGRGAIRKVRDVIQLLFGGHWRVRRKMITNGAGYEEKHPQRLLLRRASHQNFQFADEDEDEYLLALHGRPDGVPPDATVWGDLDAYPAPPSAHPRSLDVYVVTSSTGTRHLIKRRFTSLRDRVVAESVKCACGLEVDPETIAAAGDVKHFGQILHWLTYEGDYLGQMDPQSVFEDDLCGRCWASYASSERGPGGEVKRYVPPTDDYVKLVPFPGEETHD